MNKSLTNLSAVIVRLHTLRQVKVELKGSEGSSAELKKTSSWMKKKIVRKVSMDTIWYRTDQ